MELLCVRLMVLWWMGRDTPIIFSQRIFSGKLFLQKILSEIIFLQKIVLLLLLRLIYTVHGLVISGVG